MRPRGSLAEPGAQAPARGAVSGCSRQKCAATPIVADGMVAIMDELEQTYRTLVEPIRGYPISEATRKRILAEVEAAYRRERAAREARGEVEDRG